MTEMVRELILVKLERGINFIVNVLLLLKIVWKWDQRKIFSYYKRFIPPEDYKPLKKFKKIYLT